MTSDALGYATFFSMTGFAERNYVQFMLFGIALVMMIILGRFSTLITFESKWAWHSSILDLIMYGFTGVFFLWFALPIVFEILADVPAVIALPITHVFSTLLFPSLITFAFLATIFRSESFPSRLFSRGMSSQSLRLGLFPSGRIAGRAQAFSLQFPLASASLTNNYRHTVIIT